MPRYFEDYWRSREPIQTLDDHVNGIMRPREPILKPETKKEKWNCSGQPTEYGPPDGAWDDSNSY